MNHPTFFTNDPALRVSFRVIFVALLVLLTNCLHGALAQDSGLKISLSEKERTWLENNPEITLGYADSQEPQLIVNLDGSYSGIVVDLLDELNRRLGTSIKLAAFPIKEAIAKAQGKDIDGILNIHPGYADRLNMLKTKGYFQIYPTVFARRDLVFNGPKDIPGKTVAIIDKTFFSEKIIKEYEGQVTIKRVTSALEGLQSLANGDADLFIGVSHNSYLLTKYQLFDISAKYIYTDYSDRVVVAIRSDWPILTEILNKGLSSLSDTELKQIVARWVYHTEEKPTIDLTADERDWLAKHPDIELGCTDAFEPEVIVNPDGSYRGTLVDVLDLLNQRLGTDFKVTVKPIPDLIKQVSQKELAGVLGIHPTYADKLGWLRTKSYMTTFPTIFARKGLTFDTPSDLAGKKIAIIDKIFFSQNLVDLYGDGSTLIKVENALEGLGRVKDGTADLFIGSSSNSYLLGKYQFFDLGVTFQFYDHPIRNAMGVRSDWPQLVSILNKGLSSIAAEEIESIYQKWGSVLGQKQLLELTDEEQAWLKANPRITVGFSPLPPYMFAENGKIQGSLVDMMESLVSQVRLTADFSMQPTAETLSEIESGQLHVVLGMIHSQERAGFMYFSENVMGLQMSIFARTSRSDISDAASLENKVIASIKGYGFEPVIKKFLPSTKIIRADDTEGMLRLVASGEADAAVQELYSGEFILRDSFINGVSRKGSFDPPGLPAIVGSEFAVSRKHSLLNSILNKSYSALPESEKNRIWRRWFASDAERAARKQIKLTPEEQTWLEQNHTVRVRTADWPPYLIITENEPPQGITIEYLKLIREGTGINFEYEVASQPFAEFLESMKQRQDIDMTPLIAKTPEREEYISFTTPYISSPYVIFGREQEAILLDISGLVGKTVAVTRGFIMQQFLERDFPEIRLVLFDNDEEALRAVSTGKAEAYIGNLTVSSHIIQRRGLSNLRVVASTPYGDQVLSMGSRNDWPELTSIIDKALASITEEEKTAIRNKFVALSYDQGINRAEAIKWALIVVLTSTGVMLFFLIWNRQLLRRVKQRTSELQNTVQTLATEVTEREATEEALQQSFDYLEHLTGTVADAIFSVKMPERIIEWANDSYQVLGYEPEECIGQSTDKFYSIQEEYHAVGELLLNAIQTGEQVIHVEAQLRRKNGEIFPGEITSTIYKENNEVLSVTSLVRDISERKQAEERVKQYQNRLKSLASQLTIVEQAERRRIAAGLHDHIGQILAFSRLQLARAKKQAHDDNLISLLDDISQSLLNVIEDTKELIFDLSSPLLNEIGLDAAITDWLENQVKKGYGLEYSYRQDNVTVELNELERTILFRNFKELVVNVFKHAQASKIDVRLGGDEETFFLAVTDNGRGFDPEQLEIKTSVQGGFGLFSIQERMADIGGRVDIDSGTEKGCTITMRLPVYANEAETTQ